MATQILYTSQNGFRYFGHRKGIKGDDFISKDLCYPEDTIYNDRIYAYTRWNRQNILTRIIRRDRDTSGRGYNFLAHHLLLDLNEIKTHAGPAWLLRKKTFLDEKGFLDRYANGQQLEASKIQIEAEYYHEPRKTWQLFFSDDGERECEKMVHAITNRRNGIIIFDPTNDKHSNDNLLGLFYEAFSWVDIRNRWNITFSTFSSGEGHQNLNWNWVCVAKTDTESIQYYTRSLTKDSIIDLTGRKTKMTDEKVDKQNNIENCETIESDTLPTAEELSQSSQEIFDRLNAYSSLKGIYEDYLSNKFFRPFIEDRSAWFNSNEEIIRLETELAQEKERNMGFFEKVFKWIGIIPDKINAVELALEIEKYNENNSDTELILENSIGLSPLMLNPTTEQAEGGSCLVDFKPYENEKIRNAGLSPVIEWISFDDPDFLKAELYEKEKGKEWTIRRKSDQIDFITISLRDTKFQIEWAGGLKPEDLDFANLLLFSALRFSIEMKIVGVERPARYEQYHQILRPGDIEFKSDEKEFPELHGQLNDVVGRICLQSTELTGQENMISWIKKQLRLCVFDVSGFSGGYLKGKDDGTLGLPAILLLASQVNELPAGGEKQLKTTHCTVYKKDDRSNILLLFKS